MFKIETRPGQDRESRAFSLESKTRTWRDLNKFSRFPIFCDETRDETSWKINKQMSPRPRLFDNQNWSETGTRPRVSVLLVSRPRRDRESRPSLVGGCWVDIVIKGNNQINLDLELGLGVSNIEWPVGKRGVGWCWLDRVKGSWDGFYCCHSSTKTM